MTELLELVGQSCDKSSMRKYVCAESSLYIFYKSSSLDLMTLLIKSLDLTTEQSILQSQANL